MTIEYSALLMNVLFLLFSKEKKERAKPTATARKTIRTYATRKSIGKQNKHPYVHMDPEKVCSNQVKLVTNILYIYIMHVTFD